MCGIVGYVGKDPAAPVILKGLARLEYRGYDSAGIALGGENAIRIYKRQGTVQNLVDAVVEKDIQGTIGIGHTRWATHGEPNDVNAHPHVSQDGVIAIVHNGIIENARTITLMLQGEGYEFVSETDTEVLAHLIEYVGKRAELSFEEAVREALRMVEGAYAIAVISLGDPETMVVARKGSPLVVGVSNDRSAYFVASDATAIAEYTRLVAYINDGEMAVLKSGEAFHVSSIEGGEVSDPAIIEIDADLAEIGKDGFDHFMQKEIFEQSRTIRDSMRGRLNPETGSIKLGGLERYIGRLAEAGRIIFVACGTSYYAAVLGEYLIERYAGISVEVEIASEFLYKHPLIKPNDFVFAISQSGETADTLAAIKLAKSAGATVFGICNVVGSSIARETAAGVYTHAGPEIGVASTKAFTAQVTVLALLALALAEKRGALNVPERVRLAKELWAVSDKIKSVFQVCNECRRIVGQYADATYALFLGRNSCYPVALEGALKLKEVAYVHAEGYPAGEMKHGPIALIEDGTLVIVIAPKGTETHNKIISNIREIKARGGSIVAVVTEGDTETIGLADHAICIPAADEFVLPLLAVVPLQLIAYYSAVVRERDVDRPRNLAKSVTVE